MIEKIKNKIFSFKFIIINFIMWLSVYINVMPTYCAQYFYKDVVFLHPYLIVSGIFPMIAKAIGNWLYDIFSYLLDGCYSAYESLSQLEIIQSSNIQALLNNIDKLVYSVFFVIFIIAVICKIFKIENPLKVLANTGVCFIAVVVFSTILSLGVTMKNATIKDISSIINEGDNTISETIYAQNTVDVLKSLKENKVAYLKTNDMKTFSKEEVLKDTYLYDYPRIDENGQVVYESLSDGMWFTGWGEQRYYRYNTDFWVVNTTIVSSIIVFILAILKHGFLVVDWFIINVFGKFGIGRGIFDIGNIGKVFKSISDNLVAQVVLFAMMSLFSVYSSAIMTSDTHWMVKCILLFAFGMTVFVGSDFISKGLGINDNFGKVAASMFAASRLGRMASKNISRVVGAGKSGMDKIVSGIDSATEKTYDKMNEAYQEKVNNAMQSDNFKDAVNEGKEDYDIQQAKEKMNDQSYNEDIKERAKKEMYGDDYKVQEEKSKLMQGEEKATHIDQAKKELYGNDYKVQDEKSKLMQGEEKATHIDQAKKELYGDDYKVQEEKSKLIQGAEQEQAIHQAKEQVYGNDYKYQEVKEDVVKGEEHAELKDKAMRELHGDDYQENKMKRDIETSLQREEMKEKIIGERESSSSSSISSSYENSSKTKYSEQGSSNSNGVDDDEMANLLDLLKKGEL